MSLIPYASASYVQQTTDHFSETGGAAALDYESRTDATSIAALGATVRYQVLMADSMLVTFSSSLGWRHNFTDTETASLSLAGANPMTVAGANAAGGAAAITAGVNFDLSDTTALDFAYRGELGQHSQSHAIAGTWAMKF